MSKSEKITNTLYFIAIILIIILGILIRTDVWLNEPSFFGDEGALIYNIKNRSFFGLFSALDSAQSCPSFFLFFNKIIYLIFGLNETALRFLPFLAGILTFSIVPFFKNLLFKNKILNLLLITALILNSQLIYYSQEFKQYSSDAFFTLLIILVFFKTKDKIKDTKSALITGLVFSIIGYFCFTAEFLIFPICLYFTYIFIKNKTYKPIFYMIIPYFLGLLIQFLLIFKGMMSNGIMECWVNEPFAFSSLRLTMFTICDFTTSLYGCNIVFALFLIGIIVLLIKDRLLAYILLMPIALNMISGLLHLYPFVSNRAILYIAPIFMIICIKSFDIMPNKNKIANAIFAIIVLCLITNMFTKLENIINRTQIGDKYYYYIRSISKEYVNVLDKKEVKTDDKIFVDRQNEASFDVYYKDKNYDKNVIYQTYYHDLTVSDRNSDYGTYKLDELEKGTHIWFYNTPHYPDSVKIEEIEGWINNNSKILLRENDSMGELLYVEKIK